MSNKYHANRVKWKGLNFDSVHELERWIILQDEEKRGLITDLHRQTPFEIVPAQVYKGKKIRPAIYIADFTYIRDGQQIVEDAKGVRTEVYKLKKKLVYQLYGIMIQET